MSLLEHSSGLYPTPSTQRSQLGPVSETQWVSLLNVTHQQHGASLAKLWRGVLTLRKLGNLSNQDSYFFPSLPNSPHCSRCSLFEVQATSGLW